MAEVKVTNLVKVYTILLLRKRPMHGYEIIKSLGGMLLKDVSASHVYPFLKLLERNKLVAISVTGKRDRKEYALTAKGKMFARDLIDRFAELIEVNIAAKIRKCLHCGCRLVGGWHTEKVRGKAATFCCVRCAQSYRGAAKAQ